MSVTQEVTRILGALCREPGTDPRYASYCITVILAVINLILNKLQIRK